jgi:hypothetical protein
MMNPNERVYAWVIAFFGLLGLALIFLLFVQFFPAHKALLFTLLAIAPFVLAVGAGLYHQRVRATILPKSATPQSPPTTPAPLSSEPSTDVFTIPLWESRDLIARKWRYCLWATPALIIMFQAILLSVTCKQRCFDNFFWYGQLVIFLMPAIVVPISTATLRQAVRLLRRHPDYIPILKADAQGLTLPIQMLTEPAFHLAVAANQVEIHLNWSDITRWEVYAAAGSGKNSSPKQHLLQLRGQASANYGGIFARFGIIRVPELLAAETALLEFASRHLSCPIEVRVPPAKTQTLP